MLSKYPVGLKQSYANFIKFDKFRRVKVVQIDNGVVTLTAKTVLKQFEGEEGLWREAVRNSVGHPQETSYALVEWGNLSERLLHLVRRNFLIQGGSGSDWIELFCWAYFMENPWRRRFVRTAVWTDFRHDLLFLVITCSFGLRVSDSSFSHFWRCISSVMFLWMFHFFFAILFGSIFFLFLGGISSFSIPRPLFLTGFHVRNVWLI